MSLAFTKHGARFDFLIHEVLLLAIALVLVSDEVEMIASEEVKLVLHFPDL